MKKILSLFLTALAGLSLWCCQEEDPPFIYVEQESILAEPELYKATIGVKSNVEWTVSSGAAWCSVFGEKGSYKGSFELVLDRNTTIDERTTNVTLTGGGQTKIISVTQTSAGYGLSLPLSGYSVDNKAQSVRIAYVLSRPGAALEAFSNVEWAKPGTVKDGFAQVEIEENKSGKVREAEISLVAKGGSMDPVTIVASILQSGSEDILDVLVDEIALGSEGETKRIPVQSNSELSVVSSESWCVAAADGAFVAISADANTTGKAREAYVSLSLKEGNENARTKLIKVTQAASDIALELFVTEVTLSRTGDAVRIPFTSDAQLTLDSGAGWCKATLDGNFIAVSGEENATGAIRTAYLKVTAGKAGKEISRAILVTQGTADIVLDVPAESLLLNAAGDARNIPYSSDCPVTAKASESWFKATVAEDGIAVCADANDTGAERSGFLTITAQGKGKTLSKTVKVLQAKAEIILELPVNEITLNRLGEENALPFASNADVEVTSAAKWCKPAVKGKYIAFTATENNTGSPRETFVTVTTISGKGTEISRSIHVTQGTTDILLELPVKQVTLNRLGNAVNIPVITDAAQVTVKTNDKWCFAEMTDDGLSVSAQENNTGKERKTFVTLVARLGGKDATHILNVTQSTEELVLDIPYTELALNAAGDDRTIPCTTGGELSAEAGEDWIKARISGKKLIVSALKNDTGADREGILTVTAQAMGKTVTKTVKVLQARFEILLDVYSTEALLNLDGDEVKLPFRANVPVTVSTSGSWCHADAGQAFILLSAERNETGKERSCILTVTTDSGNGHEITRTVKVIQAITKLNLHIVEKEIDLLAQGEEKNIPFISENPVVVTTSEHWLSAAVNPGNLITIAADVNKTGSARTAYVTVTTQSGIGVELTETIKVTQSSIDVTFEFIHPEMDLEYVASTTSATLRASGEWEITNLASMPAWISITPTSGTGDANFQIRVATNKFLARRSFAFAFHDKTHDKFASLTVAQAGDPTGIKDLGYLGRGYDASGEYAVDSYVRHNVLDQDSLVLYGHVADVISVNATKEETVTGTTRSEYETNYSVSAGVSGSYKGFTASVEANFSQYALQSAEHSYGTWRHMTQKKKLTLFQNEGAAELMNALSKEFRRDIGYGGQTSGRMTPGKLIQKYGTHIVTGYALGGVLEYSMSSDATSSEQSMNWGVALKGGFESAAFGVSASVSYDQFESMKNSSASFESTLTCRGGQSQYSSMTATGSQSMYNEWLTSLKDPSQWVMVNYESPMIPIFEFIDDDHYRAQVEAYLKDYLKGLTQEQHSTHKKLTLTEASVSTNMTDAGSECEFHWLMYVKIDNQPWKYTEGTHGDEWGENLINVPSNGSEVAIDRSGTVRLSPLKNHTVKIEIKDAYEDDGSSANDKFLDKTFYVRWDGSRWSCDGTFLNDDGTFRLELTYDKSSNEHLWIQCKLVWGD